MGTWAHVDAGVARRSGRTRSGRAALASVVVVVAALLPGAVRGEPGAVAATRTTTFAAAADAAVDSANPDATWSAPKELVADASPDRLSYLRFDLSGVGSATVTSAVLRLHVRDRTYAPSPTAGAIRSVASTTWSESTLTYRTRPAVGSVVAANSGPAAQNTWVSFDVTSAIRGDGRVALALTTPDGKGVYYDSREAGAVGPQLVVTATDPVATGGTTTLAAAGDATLDPTAPSTSDGTSTRLQVGGSAGRAALVRFDLAGISGTIAKAQLRLHVQGVAGAESVAGGTVLLTPSTAWSESTVTWWNRPATSSEVWKLGAVGRNAWVTMDVTWAAKAGAPLGFEVTSSNADAAWYDAREAGANGPQLVVTTAGSVGPVTIYAAGDIARCTATHDEATAKVLDGTTGPILALGDLAYPDGSAADFANCFDPSWGRHKARLRPVPGNHEYAQAGAAPYFAYFGAAAGDPAKGYYSYDLGNWHVVAINSNCDMIGTCTKGSAEEQWLKADLAATTRPCILAYFHYPLFDSGDSAVPAMKLYWDDLRAAGADLVLNGHAHAYERWALQSPTGALDAGGIRQITVGTGGAEVYGAVTRKANSQVRATTYGVLRLTLDTSSYSWTFLPVAGQTFTDSGTTACH